MQRSKKPVNEAAECTLVVHVVPRSSKISIASWKSGEYKIKLTAPPVEGAANAQLIQFLSKVLGISTGGLEIVSGLGSRMKRIRIRGLSQENVLRLLNR